jgi:hypothetical protein
MTEISVGGGGAGAFLSSLQASKKSIRLLTRITVLNLMVPSLHDWWFSKCEISHGWGGTFVRPVLISDEDNSSTHWAIVSLKG